MIMTTSLVVKALRFNTSSGTVQGYIYIYIRVYIYSFIYLSCINSDPHRDQWYLRSCIIFHKMISTTYINHLYQLLFKLNYNRTRLQLLNCWPEIQKTTAPCMTQFRPCLFWGGAIKVGVSPLRYLVFSLVTRISMLIGS